MHNWGRAVIISIFVLFLLLCPLGSAEIMHMTIDHAGNLVTAENSIFSIEIDYSTDGTTYANITSKTFTGDVDFGIGYNSHEINGIESIDLYNPHVVELDPSTHSHTFYYVTGFTPRIAEPLDYGNEYNSQQYVVQHKVFTGYDNESNTSIWTPTTSVVAFDSQVNDGANYTATWHTKHSRVEDWVNLGRWGVFERDYDGKDTWMITQHHHIEAGQSYRLRIVGDVPIRFGEYSYKFDFVVKPSSESLSQAISNNHLYVVDPLWNSSYDIRLRMPINNTAGAGQLTDFQININISSYNVNASSLRCYNRTTGNMMAHWNESVVSGNVYELWTNNSMITSGWDNNTFCAWQTTPISSSSSSISNTFIFGDDFEDGTLDKWNVDGNSVIQTSVVKSGTYAAKIISLGGITAQSLSIDNCIIEYDWYYDYTSQLFQPYLGIYDISSNSLWAHINEHDTRRIKYRTGTGYYDYSNGAHTDSAGSWQLWKLQYRDVSPYTAIWKDSTYLGTGALWNPQADIDDLVFGSGSSHAGTTGYLDNFRIRKYNATPPVYEGIELEYYIPSLYSNATPVLNIIYSSPHEYALNQTPTGMTNTNDTTTSMGLSEIVITNYNNSASIVRNFTLTGNDLDWYQAANLPGSYSMKNSSGTIQTVTDGNFTNNLVAGDYWIESAATSSTYTVSGTIYGANGLGEGQVSVTFGSDSTTTSPSGAYSFTGVSAGTYTLSASKPGLQDASTTITVSGDTTQDLTMARAVSPAGGGQDSSDWGLPFNISGPISRLDGLFSPLQVPSDPGKINLFWYCILGFGAFMFIDGTTFRFDNSRKDPVIKLKYLISAPLSLILMFLGLLYLGLINWNSAFFINTFDGLALYFSSAISTLLGVTSPVGAVGYMLVGTGILVLGVLVFIDGLAFCLDKSRENTFLKIKYQVLIAAGLGLGILGAAVSGVVVFS